MFEKTYSHASICDKYYQKYVFFSEKIQSEIFSIPAVLKKSEEKLYFENINDFYTLHDMYVTDQEIDFQKIGKILKEIHKAGEEKSYIHGDFCLQNILKNSDWYFVIDFESPKDFEDSVYYYTNTYYVDVGIFIMKLFTTFPIYKIVSLWKKDFKSDILWFLDWYWWGFDSKEVIKYTQQEFRRKKVWLWSLLKQWKLYYFPYIILSFLYYQYCIFKLKRWLKIY